MTIWQKLKSIGILKRDEQPEIAAECARFKSDQAFQQYIDEAKFSIITQLYALGVDEVEEFQKLKRCQLALDGFGDFIDGAIMTEKMKQKRADS